MSFRDTIQAANRTRPRNSAYKRRRAAKKRSARKSFAERLQLWCMRCRNPGHPNSATSSTFIPSEEEEIEFQTYSPFDPMFMVLVRKGKRHEPAPSTACCFESVSPFDEKFPTGISFDSHKRRKRHSLRSAKRPKLSCRTRRLRRLARKLREYGREEVLKRRAAKRAFRGIPVGLRFPSARSIELFESVSPFDERFPYGSLRPTKQSLSRPMAERKAHPSTLGASPAGLPKGEDIYPTTACHPQCRSSCDPTGPCSSGSNQVECRTTNAVGPRIIIPFPPLTPIARSMLERSEIRFFASPHSYQGRNTSPTNRSNIKPEASVR